MSAQSGVGAEAGAAVAQAALGAVGSRFRLHGREAATGLDCVGLVALALCATGQATGQAAGQTAWSAGAVPTGYAMRGGDPVAVAAWLDAVLEGGLARCAGDAPGDVLMLRTGPGQLHFAVRSADGIVHADAVLRRVVERPGPVMGQILACWRIGGEG